MTKIKILLAIISIIMVFDCHAQTKLTNEQYAQKYGDMAREQMSRYGIPASVTLAQGILESGGGASRLAVKANNHFGIKCGSSWSGATISHDDDSRGECFRKYSSVEESYLDHSLFLVNGSRYSGLFKLSSTDYEGWSRGLSLAGYATDPQYADLLIGIIERGKLWEYDNNLSGGGRVRVRPSRGKKETASQLSAVEETPYGKENGVLYATVGEDQTLASFSQQVHVSVRNLMKYNDLTFDVPLKKGMAIYLQPKKSKSQSLSHCMAQSGDNMHTLSQKYGIKLSSLYRMNPTYRYTQPKVGDCLRLR